MVKKSITTLAILFLAIVSTGCFETTNTISVKADGSGTITQTILVSNKMKEMGGAMAGGGAAPAADAKNPMIEGMLKDESIAKSMNMFGEGVKLKEAKEFKHNDGREGIRVIFTFDDINKITMAAKPAPPGSSKPGAKQPKLDTPGVLDSFSAPIKFKFTKATTAQPATLKVLIKEPDNLIKGGADKPKANADDPMAAQMKAMMSQMLEGLKITMEIKVDGTLVKSDATYMEKNTMTIATMDLGKMMTDESIEKKLKSVEGKSKAEMYKLLKDPEIKKVLQVETKPEVTITFK